MEICLCFQIVGAQATAGLTYKNTNKIFLLIGSVLERRRSVTCGLASVFGSFAMPAPSTIGRDGNGLSRFDPMCKAFNPVLESIPSSAMHNPFLASRDHVRGKPTTTFNGWKAKLLF